MRERHDDASGHDLPDGPADALVVAVLRDRKLADDEDRVAFGQAVGDILGEVAERLDPVGDGRPVGVGVVLLLDPVVDDDLEPGPRRAGRAVGQGWVFGQVAFDFDVTGHGDLRFVGSALFCRV